MIDPTDLFQPQWEDMDPQAAEINRLRAEIEALTTAGIAEVAARNQSVMEYMHHWEARATAAEAALADIDDLITFEINPSNYDHDQVCEMNSIMCQVVGIAQDYSAATITATDTA